MFLLPARCLPQDLVNPFMGFAIITTGWAVGWIVWTLTLLFVLRGFGAGRRGTVTTRCACSECGATGFPAESVAQLPPVLE